jgi:hypothetical protein
MTRKQLTLLVGFLMLLSFLAGNRLNRIVLVKANTLSQTSQPVNIATPKWEYKVFSMTEKVSTPNLEVTAQKWLEVSMNKWGDQGFELAEFEVVYEDRHGSFYNYVVMKRPKK